MSEVVGTAVVEVVGNLKPLQQQVAQLGPQLQKSLGNLTPSAQALANRSGVTRSLQGLRKETKTYESTLADLAVAERVAAESSEKLSKGHEAVAVHAHRANIAGLALRSSTVAAGAGLLIAAQAVNALSKKLETADGQIHSTGDAARNFGAHVLRGDFIGALSAATADITLTSAALESLQAQFAAGKTAEISAYVEALRKIPGTGKAIAQISAAQLQTRSNLITDQATRASLTPGLKDDLTSANRAVAEASSVVRQSDKGTEQYTRAYQAYAKAVQDRRKVQDQISSKSSPTTRDEDRSGRFQLNLLRAQSNDNTKAAQAILTGRRDYLKTQIGVLEDEGRTSKAAQARLTVLYGQLDDVEGKISSAQKDALAKRQARLQETIALQQTSLQIAEANARGQAQENAAVANESAFAKKLSGDKRLDAQTRAGYALQAAQLDKQIFEANQAAAQAAKQAAEEAARKREEERKQALADAKAAKERAVSLREARIQLRVQTAQLTRSNTDDKSALRALIRFYGQQAALARKSGALAKAVEFQSQKVGAQLSLKNLGSSTASGGATSAEFFAKAAQQFNEFGSNISGRNGVLSGQDARGAFAGLALRNRASGTASIAGEITGAIQQTGGATLTQLQIQTHLLAVIANGVRRNGVPGAQADRDAINKARAKASHLGNA